MPILTPDSDDPEESDYTLTGTSCWLTVGSLSVYVVNTGDGVAVEIYPLQQASEDPIAEIWAPFADAH